MAMKDVYLVLLTLFLALRFTLSFPSGDESRMANGVPAASGEFPYIVSIQTWNDEHLCSGFIYSTYHVVTAASCVYGKTASEIKILAGVSSLIAQSDVAQLVGVYRIDVHPSFNPITKANDVAMIKLATTLSFNTYVQHILYDEVDPAISTSITAGWGATEESGLNTINLRKLTLNLKPSSECESAYTTSEYSQNFMICAGSETASPCRYDEGSPLIQNGIAVGVMSRNKGCTAPYPPTVYTRLSAHYSWILRIGGTQPPLPATPYPTPTAGTTFTSSTTQPTTTESTALPTTASTTQGTTTKFVVPTAPCYNCIP